MPWKIVVEMAKDLGGAQGALLMLAGAGAFTFFAHKKRWITITRSNGNGKGNEDEETSSHEAVCPVPSCSKAVIHTSAKVEQLGVFQHTLSTKLDNLSAHVAIIPDMKDDIQRLFDLAGDNSNGIATLLERTKAL